MGQAERTTKLELDLRERGQGGANTEKRRYLEAMRRGPFTSPSSWLIQQNSWKRCR